MSELPSSNRGLLLFAGLTIGYFTIQYKTQEKYSSVAMIVYLILLLVFQFGININLTKTLCGESQVKTAFFYTMFP
jgi:hypothetical protein